MKFKILVFLFAGLFIMPNMMEGQILDRVINKAQRKVINKGEKALEDKFLEAVDRGLDKLGAAAKDKYGVIEEPIEGNYSFNQKVTYEMYDRNKRGKKKDVTVMYLWLADGDYLAMEADENKSSIAIVDETRLITVMDDSKSYMAFDLTKTAEGNELDEDATDSDFTIEKIGSETLLGYNCDIFLATSEDMETKMWVTSAFQTLNFTDNIATLTQNRHIPDMEPVGGLTLKMESRKEGEKEVHVMEAVSIDKKSHSVNMSEYTNIMAAE